MPDSLAASSALQMQWLMVVDVPDVPRFLAGAGFQSPLGGLGLLGLKLGAQGDLALAVPVEATPRRCVAAADGGNVEDAEIHTDEPGRLSPPGVGDFHFFAEVPGLDVAFNVA